MNRTLTQRELFKFLESLGFEEIAGRAELAYVHKSTGTVLLFSSTGQQNRVSNADLLSVQTRLEKCGLIDDPLSQLLSSSHKRTKQ